ncbi:hypothetical protein H113_08495 [Trichophyton rubrum MR1459]|uniref:Secreted protein n=1 Tax=Trichophyton rubrum (strain ATCC MYA-4607 / CBS 118892) TaxID=559305 RepID=A0A080WKA7_TRIRC|nr:uncharacterized protein TERG_11656 [Trichophyton rubrum CBS 118892]EZF90417.1 hypothetical protein H113_08495 [Trichophyton rubrum MR1459]KFL60440.1 hypothetical protein TERG_11656 [Trichophyton rubrum CBS 118892]
MDFRHRIAWASLWLVTALIWLADGKALNETLYKPRFKPPSKSTPRFAKDANISVAGRPVLYNSHKFATTGDLPIGTCAPGTPCVNGACCSKARLFYSIFLEPRLMIVSV